MGSTGMKIFQKCAHKAEQIIFKDCGKDCMRSIDVEFTISRIIVSFEAEEPLHGAYRRLDLVMAVWIVTLSERGENQ